jgi:hypothetical protein
MKNSAANLGAAAIALLIGVTGCNSQQRSSELVSQQRSAGSAHLAAVTFGGTRKAEIKDPANDETAFTVDVPSGWKFVGAILRPRGCHAPATAADGLSYTSLGQDGVTATGQLPGVSWGWASDGISPQGPKCQPVNITSAAGFLLNIAVPNIHPNAKIIGIVPLSEKMQAGLEAQRRNMQSAGGPRRTMDTARVRIEYDLNGQLIEEQLGTVIDCQESYTPAYPQMRRPARTMRNCNSHGTYIKRAPKGRLDALLANNLPLAQIDHEWDMHISQQMRERFAAYQQASDARFQAIQKNFQAQTDAMLQRGRDAQATLKAGTDRAIAQDRANQGAIDHAAHQQVLDSLNRQDFIDPTTGQKIETSNQFSHNWISSDKNSVVLNDDPTFDPNGVVDPNRQSWIQLIPSN